MLIRFFLMLRAAGVPVTVTEFLAMLEALQKGTVHSEYLSAVETFYFLARAILVKDERHYDRYDRVFAAHFRGRGNRVRGDARSWSACGLAGETHRSCS